MALANLASGIGATSKEADRLAGARPQGKSRFGAAKVDAGARLRADRGSEKSAGSRATGAERHTGQPAGARHAGRHPDHGWRRRNRRSRPTTSSSRCSPSQRWPSMAWLWRRRPTADPTRAAEHIAQSRVIAARFRRRSSGARRLGDQRGALFRSDEDRAADAEALPQVSGRVCPRRRRHDGGKEISRRPPRAYETAYGMAKEQLRPDQAARSATRKPGS